MALVGAWTIICTFLAFRELKINPVTQLQMQGANSKNRTIRIIRSKIIFHHGDLINVSQSEVTEASGEFTVHVVQGNHLVHVFSKVSYINVHISYICTTLGMNKAISSSLCSH